MTDIRIFGDIAGTMVIGEYVEKTTGELNLGSNNGIISRVLKDTMSLTLQPVPTKTGDRKLIPMVFPINPFASEFRGSIDDIDVDKNCLVEFKNIPLENRKFIVDSYNQVMTGIDLNVGSEMPQQPLM